MLFEGDVGENVWRLITAFYNKKSTQRDVIYLVNDGKQKAYRIGFTLGL
ncbi:hypothetical protein EVB87_104 [Rhizobium phage RHph_N28_1]|nr:hypothetical protein EVB87_104 [Rhizobium phage RHph_N28_1]QIG74132.1 hypothetical protein EVC07_104 [Rhizobium phage RHph_N42]QXV73791.1 hypothetical protein [Rhizobium phage RHph_N46]